MDLKLTPRHYLVTHEIIQNTPHLNGFICEVKTSKIRLLRYLRSSCPSWGQILSFFLILWVKAMRYVSSYNFEESFKILSQNTTWGTSIAICYFNPSCLQAARKPSYQFKGPWGVIIGRLYYLYYTRPIQNLFTCFRLHLSRQNLYQT